MRAQTQKGPPPPICLSRGKPPPEDVLDMFKWFFPILPKMPNLMLIVYLPKIFSSVAGLFRLDPLHLLSAGTVLTLEPSVRCVSGVLVCVPHPGPVYWSLVCGSELSTVPALSRRRGSRWNRPATEEKIFGK